ncbi:hypothetical protein GW17_00061850 [Ensete ventricosum]|nr:hypothetical protein GW17_00061850 [Ensete ventricosum]
MHFISFLLYSLISITVVIRPCLQLLLRLPPTTPLAPSPSPTAIAPQSATKKGRLELNRTSVVSYLSSSRLLQLPHYCISHNGSSVITRGLYSANNLEAASVAVATANKEVFQPVVGLAGQPWLTPDIPLLFSTDRDYSCSTIASFDRSS